MSPAEQTDGSERRVATRAALHRPARVLLRDGAASECKTNDISVSGVGVLSEVALPKGALCAVNFTIVFADDSAYVVKAITTIAYSVFSSERGGFKIGLAFHQPAQPLVSAIERYVAESRQVFRFG